MELIDQSKSILENLYYLSGILILAGLLIAILQLFFAKRTLNVNSRREAAKLASQQIEIYATKIIPLNDELYNLEKELKFEKPKVNIKTFTKSDFIERNKTKKINDEEYRKCLSCAAKVFNAMESFSVYFTKGIADEEIAFSSVGFLFTFTVESLYFYMVFWTFFDDIKLYQNLMQLYTIWRERIKKEKLIVNQESISKQIKLIKDIKINPIGTEH